MAVSLHLLYFAFERWDIVLCHSKLFLSRGRTVLRDCGLYWVPPYLYFQINSATNKGSFGAYANSKDLDQTAHPQSLIKVFAVRLKICVF